MKHIKQAAQTITKIFIKSAIKLALCLALFTMVQTAVAHDESECTYVKSSKSSSGDNKDSEDSDTSIKALKKLGYGDLIKKANEGDVKSQYDLGKMYFYGKIIKQDFEKALFWLKKVAKKGCPTCSGDSAWIYGNNGKKAAFLFKRRPRIENISSKKNFQLKTKVK